MDSSLKGIPSNFSQVDAVDYQRPSGYVNIPPEYSIDDDDEENEEGEEDQDDEGEFYDEEDNDEEDED